MIMSIIMTTTTTTMTMMTSAAAMIMSITMTTTMTTMTMMTSAAAMIMSIIMTMTTTTHHHGHDADEVFTSWGRETAKKYSDDQIRSILKTLSESDENSYGIILRAKGMVPRADGTWINFDMVPEESEVRDGAADYTGRLCVIGSKLNEEKIAELFGV